MTPKVGCIFITLRAGTDGCSSFDFYFTPNGDSLSMTVTLYNSSRIALEATSFKIKNRMTDQLVLKAVSVCGSKNQQGFWICSDPGDLVNSVELASKIYPTSITVDT